MQSLREAFGEALVSLADDINFTVFDSDVAGGTGVNEFRYTYPERFVQMGIAEQNTIGAAVGYSLITGYPVVVAGMAPFLMRAWEIARLSVGYNKANVKIVASHVGLDTGPDGASAQCLEDIACWRAIPGMVVLSPGSHREMLEATEWMLKYVGPVYMRTGRSPLLTDIHAGHSEFFAFNRVSTIFSASNPRVVIFSTGGQTAQALVAAQEIYTELGYSVVRVIHVPVIKPMPDLSWALRNLEGRIIVTEDHNVYGGLGGAIAEKIMNTTYKPYHTPISFLGVQDVFGESGDPQELKEKYGIGKNAIKSEIYRLLQ